MHMSKRAKTQPADPATLATLLRSRATSRDADPAVQAYVAHWDTCKQGCHTAQDEAGLCALGKQLYNKWQRKEGNE
jgi:hypothetical protein